MRHTQDTLAIGGHVEQWRWSVREVHLEQWAQRLHLQRLRVQTQFRSHQLVANAQKEELAFLVPSNGPSAAV
jgi:hypothetical protein